MATIVALLIVGYAAGWLTAHALNSKPMQQHHHHSSHLVVGDEAAEAAALRRQRLLFGDFE